MKAMLSQPMTGKTDEEIIATKNKEIFMTNDDMLELSKKIVVNYFNSRVDKTDNMQITKDNVFIVWFSKTLQNFKALVSTTISDGMYYEVTYNGDKNELYLDAYKKWENKRIVL